jgi:hypothetical protein
MDNAGLTRRRGEMKMIVAPEMRDLNLTSVQFSPHSVGIEPDNLLSDRSMVCT